jgi:hypothetical protein
MAKPKVHKRKDKNPGQALLTFRAPSGTSIGIATVQSGEVFVLGAEQTML